MLNCASNDDCDRSNPEFKFALRETSVLVTAPPNTAAKVTLPFSSSDFYRSFRNVGGSQDHEGFCSKVKRACGRVSRIAG